MEVEVSAMRLQYAIRHGWLVRAPHTGVYAKCSHTHKHTHDAHDSTTSKRFHFTIILHAKHETRVRCAGTGHPWNLCVDNEKGKEWKMWNTIYWHRQSFPRIESFLNDSSPPTATYQYHFPSIYPFVTITRAPRPYFPRFVCAKSSGKWNWFFNQKRKKKNGNAKCDREKGKTHLDAFPMTCFFAFAHSPSSQSKLWYFATPFLHRENSNLYFNEPKSRVNFLSRQAFRMEFAQNANE